MSSSTWEGYCRLESFHFNMSLVSWRCKNSKKKKRKKKGNVQYAHLHRIRVNSHVCSSSCIFCAKETYETYNMNIFLYVDTVCVYVYLRIANSVCACAASTLMSSFRKKKNHLLLALCLSPLWWSLSSCLTFDNFSTDCVVVMSSKQMAGRSQTIVHTQQSRSWVVIDVWWFQLLCAKSHWCVSF